MKAATKASHAITENGSRMQYCDYNYLDKVLQETWDYRKTMLYDKILKKKKNTTENTNNCTFTEISEQYVLVWYRESYVRTAQL